MNSFLRNVTAGLSGREGLVKEELTNQLSSSVKEVQLDQANRGDKSEPLGTDDVTSSLCIVLEAIFIHGLKDTFINRVSQAIGTSDIDQRPEPTFWSPLLVFSHREIIDQVNGLFLVSTDVGRSRAWIRLALNDGLLSSYLSAMRRESAALKPYYQARAFLRDTELLDVAQRLIEGVDNYPFALACNSSLLNTWTNQPLLLAGLWTPPLGTCPVTSGIDVASTLIPDQLPIAKKDSSPSCIGSSLCLDEDEALKIILGTPVSQPPPILESARPTDIPGVSGLALRTHETSEEENSIPGTSLGNSLTGRLGWSSSFDELPTSDTPHPAIETPVLTTVRSPSDFQSYHSLVESYNLVSGSYVKTPDLRDFMQRFQDISHDQAAVASEVDDLTGLGFEVIPTSPTSLFNIPDFTNLVQQLGKLGLERGLDSQNYMCDGCSHPIGINLGQAQVCAFTGSYYCTECHKGEEWVIPARIIHNWDYRRYSVCHKAASFLEEIQHHPLIDLKALNPRLYLVVGEMADLQGLRIQLNLLRGYLFTCREPIIEELQKRVWPREYLYEHVHLYSVADLLQIPSGALAQLLTRVVSFAREHVLTCWLCSQKGFICEVCNNNKVIYPFDTDATYRCIQCSAVFHFGCMNSNKPCPKCLRKQLRVDSPLMEVND